MICKKTEGTMPPHDLNRSSLAHQTGRLFVLSAPSGAGKTTLRKALMDRFPDLCYSISHTTRQPRTGEQDGVDYYFIDQDEFKQRLDANRWAEWARVHENYYGTSADFLDRCLSGRKDVLLDIDVQGARQILDRYPESITIFIMPPSLETLRRRLSARGTDNAQTIALRLVNAQREIAQKDRYRHVLINDQLSEAVASLCALVEAYRTGVAPD